MLRQGKGAWKAGLDPGCLTLEHLVSTGHHLVTPGQRSPCSLQMPMLVGEFLSAGHRKHRLTTELTLALLQSPGQGTWYNWLPSPTHDQHPLREGLKNSPAAPGLLWFGAHDHCLMGGVLTVRLWTQRRSGRSTGLRLMMPWFESQPSH